MMEDSASSWYSEVAKQRTLTPPALSPLAGTADCSLWAARAGAASSKRAPNLSSRPVTASCRSDAVASLHVSFWLASPPPPPHLLCHGPLSSHTALSATSSIYIIYLTSPVHFQQLRPYQSPVIARCSFPLGVSDERSTFYHPPPSKTTVHGLTLNFPRSSLPSINFIYVSVSPPL